MKHSPPSLQWRLDSAIGPIHLVATERGVSGILWERQPVALAPSLTGRDPKVSLLEQAAREIEEYLDGKRRRFTFPLDVSGTPFQERVWAELRKIPYGETISYAQLAERVGQPRAFRAVGTANGRNPVSIAVPCHRVIAAGGKLGGYAGGLPVKTRLLELERATG